MKKTIKQLTPDNIAVLKKQYPNAQINDQKLKMQIIQKDHPQNFKSKPKNVSSVSNKEQEVFKFFSEHSPCWFEGCEDLRKQYNEEFNKLPKNCPSCQKGALIRKYKPKVTKLLEKHHAQENSTNGQ